MLYFTQIYLIRTDDLAAAECQKDAIPFLCLYGFPICSCIDKQLILPTKEECERISTTTCQAEFNLALLLGFGDIVPDCSQLPSRSDESGKHNYYFLIAIEYNFQVLRSF